MVPYFLSLLTRQCTRLRIAPYFFPHITKNSTEQRGRRGVHTYVRESHHRVILMFTTSFTRVTQIVILTHQADVAEATDIESSINAFVTSYVCVNVSGAASCVFVHFHRRSKGDFLIK